MSLCEGGGGLQDWDGKRPFRWVGECPEVRVGDFLVINGRWEKGEFGAEYLKTLVPVSSCWDGKGDWGRFQQYGGKLRNNLYCRDLIIRAIRSFFQNRGFLEVETPTIVRAPGQEAHLELFETAFSLLGE